MDNKIVNKQIPLQSIIEVANKLEDYKEEYQRRFEVEISKNKDVPISERNYEYGYGDAKVSYKIGFRNGKDIKEYDYNWFIGSLNEPWNIKEIELDLSIYFHRKNNSSDEYCKVLANIEFLDSKSEFKYSNTRINVDTTNMESEAHNVYADIANILEDNEDRYNNTIKHRKVRMRLCQVKCVIFFKISKIFIIGGKVLSHRLFFPLVKKVCVFRVFRVLLIEVNIIYINFT